MPLARVRTLPLAGLALCAAAHTTGAGAYEAGTNVALRRLLEELSGYRPAEGRLSGSRPDVYDAARRFLAELQNLPHRRWYCPGCGELVEGPFDQCWNCGADRPGAFG